MPYIADIGTVVEYQHVIDPDLSRKSLVLLGAASFGRFDPQTERPELRDILGIRVVGKLLGVIPKSAPTVVKTKMNLLSVNRNLTSCRQLMIVVAETQHQIHTTGPIVDREITRFEIYFGEFPDKLTVLVLAFALDTRIASGCSQRIAVQLPAFRGNGRLLRNGHGLCLKRRIFSRRLQHNRDFLIRKSPGKRKFHRERLPVDFFNHGICILRRYCPLDIGVYIVGFRVTRIPEKQLRFGVFQRAELHSPSLLYDFNRFGFEIGPHGHHRCATQTVADRSRYSYRYGVVRCSTG